MKCLKMPYFLRRRWLSIWVRKSKPACRGLVEKCYCQRAHHACPKDSVTPESSPSMKRSPDSVVVILRHAVAHWIIGAFVMIAWLIGTSASGVAQGLNIIRDTEIEK